MIDPISRQILLRELGPPTPTLQIALLPSPPIVRRIRPEALRKTMAALVAAIARWVDMSPVEMRGHPAIAGNPASREIKEPLVVAGTVAVAVMPIAAAEAAEAVEIAAAGKRGDEEFQ